jgi:hypothetical protein
MHPGDDSKHSLSAMNSAEENHMLPELLLIVPDAMLPQYEPRSEEQGKIDRKGTQNSRTGGGSGAGLNRRAGMRRYPALMVELLEDQIRFHVLDPQRRPSSEQAVAADGLVETIKSYLK